MPASQTPVSIKEQNALRAYHQENPDLHHQSKT